MNLEDPWGRDMNVTPTQAKRVSWFWFCFVVLMWGVLAFWALSEARQAPSTSGVCQVLTTIRPDYPKQNVPPEGNADMLNRAAWVMNQKAGAKVWGLLGKSSGNRCRVPGTNVDVSCDHILHIPTLRSFDALTDVGRTSGPCDPKRPPELKHVWKADGGNKLVSADGTVRRTLVHAVQPGGKPPEPEPKPCPPAPTCPPTFEVDLKRCLEERDAERVSFNEQLQERDREINRLHQKIAGIGCRPGNILGIKGFHAGCTVTGRD